MFAQVERAGWWSVGVISLRGRGGARSERAGSDGQGCASPFLDASVPLRRTHHLLEWVVWWQRRLRCAVSICWRAAGSLCRPPVFDGLVHAVIGAGSGRSGSRLGGEW